MTRFRVGSATDVGQVRSNNQDSWLVADEASVFAVADGMGGHQGGEVASAIAVETMEATIADGTTTEAVVEAVREANRRIFARAEDAHELRGMGTTLVALALVNQGEEDEEVAWVNVGDSRAYLLRDGDLTQLSRDHSLVEDLRRGGQLSDEEAAVHPQRNILTRALGIDREVEVDSGAVLPFLGDRFLLCSDGLFNEVARDDIVATLTDVEDPDAAAQELVRQANAGGGRDNITCVVVDVVDDGGRAARAAEAAAATRAADEAADADQAPTDDLADGDGAAGSDPAEAPTEPATEPVTQPVDGGADDEDITPPHGTPVPPAPPVVAVGAGATTATAAAAAAVDGRAEPDAGAGEAEGAPPADGPFPAPEDPGFPTDDPPEQPEPGDDLPFGRRTSGLYEDMDHVGGRHKALTAAVAVGVVVLVLGGAYLALGWYAGRTYFVAADGSEVVIYRGQPGGFLVFDPEVEERTALDVDDLTDDGRERVEGEAEFDSLDDARSFVNRERLKAEQEAAKEDAGRDGDETTTTTTTEGTTTTDGGAPTTTEGAPTTTEGP